MAAFNFPDTAGKPTDGSFTYAAPDGTVYKWNGYAWQVQESSGGGGGGGGGDAARVATQVIPPSPAEDGDMYWCTDDGRLYIYYTEDATDPNPNPTSQWVDASPEDGLSGVERLIAGNNIILSPEDGKGIVTVSSTGGGGGPTTPGVRYQEGTWTPELAFNYSAGGNWIWWRIGNSVYLQGAVGNFSNRVDTRSVLVSGLPYPSKYSSLHVGSCQSKNTAIPSNGVWMGGDQFTFYANGSNTGDNWEPLKYNQTVASTTVAWSISYETDDTTFAPVNGAVVTEDIEGTGGSGGGGGGTTVNYNGTSAWGSISSTGEALGGFNYTVNYVGDGTYDVSFVTAMPNVNYSVTATSANSMCQVLNLTTTGFRIRSRNSSGDLTNGAVYFAVHTANAIAPQSGVGADAWGRISGTAGIIDGFNVKSSGRVEGATTGTFEIEFTTPMPTDKYSVVITPTNSNYYGGVSGVTREGFKVYLRNNDNGGALGNSEFAFTVHASSTVTPTYTWTRDGTTLKPANDGDTLEASSATFAGDVTLNSNLLVKNGDTGGVFIFGSDNTIKTRLEGNGSAEFAGDILSGTAWANNDEGAIRLRNSASGKNASVDIKGDTDAIGCFTIRAGGNTLADSVVRIDGNGSASFAGGNGVDTNASCGITSSGTLQIRNDSGNNDVIQIRNNSASNVTMRVSASGTATFASRVSAPVFGGNTLVRPSFGGLAISSQPVNGTARPVICPTNDTGTISASPGISLGSDSFPWYNIKTSNARTGSLILETEADDDTKYTTTTDVDGNETRVYNGGTLDVKEMLLNFQAKIQTLEAAKAALEARVVTLETQQSSGN